MNTFTFYFANQRRIFSQWMGMYKRRQHLPAALRSTAITSLPSLAALWGRPVPAVRKRRASRFNRRAASGKFNTHNRRLPRTQNHLRLPTTGGITQRFHAGMSRSV